MSSDASMQKKILTSVFRYFVAGIFAVFPIVVSVYIIYILVHWIEKLFYKILPDASLPPGIGFVVIIGLLVLIGFIASISLFKKIWTWSEDLVSSIPILSTIYKSLKGIADYLNPQNKMMDGKSVIVTIPELDCKMLGFLTNDQVANIDDHFKEKDNVVAVYLPMSYQVGGFTIFVEEKYIEKIDMKVDKLMQGTLMGWVGNQDQKDKKKT
ncbi:MAG: DUF502 domain-containing protein [Bdellovibrionales bacterium]|nr:DUF502 domain-containing protein [Bdellovibrionales bacterium]